MPLDMTLHIIADAPAVDEDWEPSVTIPAGAEVEYCGHMPGGAVKVRYSGSTYIISPKATEELAA